MHDAAYKMLYSNQHMVAELLRGFLPGGAPVWRGYGRTPVGAAGARIGAGAPGGRGQRDHRLRRGRGFARGSAGHRRSRELNPAPFRTVNDLRRAERSALPAEPGVYLLLRTLAAAGAG